MQRRIKIVLTSLLTLGIALPMAAEDVPILRQNQFEVGGFAGFSYGADRSHVMGGGNITYSALRWLLPYAEVSYLPGIQRTVIGYSSNVPTAKDVYDIPFTAADFGVHVRVQIPHTRIVPYAVVGAGLLHWGASTDQDYTNSSSSSSLSSAVWQPGTPPTIPVPSGTNFAGNFGGGIRYYLGEQFGLRAETKGYRVNNAHSSAATAGVASWIYQATFGVFFQFGR